jgi:thiosulfate/3-mercaptopyruvate sulfurtransferase
MSKWLIETDALAQLLAKEPDADRIIVDCSWYLPDSEKHALDDFHKNHIPSAQFLDLNEISDPTSKYVNMLPQAELFASVVGRLGIGANTEVIIYDAGYVSARIWWMFRTFGHNKVKILNGGLRKWIAEERALETGDANSVETKHFPAKLINGRVASISEVREIVATAETPIIDARTAARFDGHEGSGYPGVASGYMPGAINTPWQLFFEPAPSHRFISPEKAKEIFLERGVDVSGDIITTCGSGVTASILGFMLEEIGNSDWRLYDGSWHEWGQQEDTPKQIKPL